MLISCAQHSNIQEEDLESSNYEAAFELYSEIKKNDVQMYKKSVVLNMAQSSRNRNSTV